MTTREKEEHSNRGPMDKDVTNRHGGGGGGGGGGKKSK